MRTAPGLLLAVVLLSSCATTPTVTQTPSQKTGREEQLLAGVKKINDSGPARVKAGVTVVGILNGQQYSADGIAYLSDNPVRAKVTLSDRIFKSPVAHILADPSEMKMYFPIEKTAYTIRGDFSNPDLQGRADSQLLLAYSFTSKIPLLESYTIFDYEKGANSAREIVTLSSGSIKEKITFADGKPVKVELENSSNGTSYTLRYYGMYEKEGHTFFRKIQAYSTVTGDKATIHYNMILVNPRINESSVFSLTIPSGTKIIH